jgi:hypothetical protein
MHSRTNNNQNQYDQGQYDSVSGQGVRHPIDSSRIDQQSNLNDYDQSGGRTHGQVYDSNVPVNTNTMGTTPQTSTTAQQGYSGAHHPGLATGPVNYTTVPPGQQNIQQPATGHFHPGTTQPGYNANVPGNTYNDQAQGQYAQAGALAAGAVKATTGEKIRGQIRQTMGEFQDNPRKIAEGAALKEGTHPIQTGQHAAPRRNI